MVPARLKRRPHSSGAGGVMLLAAAERGLGVAQRLARLIVDRRNPLLVTHSVADILRLRL
jgi:hypothetical protein